MGSIASSFKFISYKVDQFRFKSSPNLSVLEYDQFVDKDTWKMQIKIRQPYYFEEHKRYVGGLDAVLRLDSLEPEDCENQQVSNETEESSNILTLVAGIAGSFAIESERFEGEMEENLVKYQIPALLFPYLRGAITSFLANAGFGTAILPLINIYELSKQSLEDVEIKIVE